MAGYQGVVGYDPVPELLSSPGQNSEEKQQQLEEKERPFKVNYVPLPAGAYTELPMVMVPTLEFGGNFFSRMLPFDDSKVLFRALLQRCHRDEQLHQHRFVFLGPDGQAVRDVKLPLGISLDDFAASPPRDPYTPSKRWAVAIDCEMVGVAVPPPTPQELAVSKTATGWAGRGMPTNPAQAGRGRGRAAATGPNIETRAPPQGPHNPRKPPTERSELAQLCAVDVLTGDVLINVLVQPQGRVVSWRTRYSGITPKALREAKAQGAYVVGWAEARALLLEHVDASTILVGHSLNNDLPMLRLAHTRVVDTALQTAEAVYGAVDRFPRIWGLRDLLRDLAGLAVQNHGRRGHSCLEDALATRELALWCLRFPRRLEAWGAAQRGHLEVQALEREKKAAKDKEKAASAATATKAEEDAVGLKNDVRSGPDKMKKRLRRKPKPQYAH